jgi:K+ transporter
MLPGKQFIADLSSHMQAAFGVSVTSRMLLDELKAEDLDQEMIQALKQLDGFFWPG